MHVPKEHQVSIDAVEAEKDKYQALIDKQKQVIQQPSAEDIVRQLAINKIPTLVSTQSVGAITY